MIAITSENFQSVKDRIEAFNSWQDKQPKYIVKGKPWDPRDNIVAVRNRFKGDVSGWVKEWFFGRNIVTNIGDQYYAEMAVGTTVTNDFGGASNRCELQNPVSADTPAKTDTYTNVTTPITASRKTITATYPKVSDNDTDNTGGGTDIASWDYSWTVSDFNTESANNIVGGCIHLGAGAPVGGTVLLTHWTITAFEKTSSDTLKVFHNHTFNGI